MVQPPEARLERLEAVLEELIEANERTPVIVEGKRDRDSLVRLGLVGEVILLNVGKSRPDLMAEIYREHRSLIVLTDWDAKGQELFDRLTRLATAEGIKVEEGFWRVLQPLVQKDIQAVEDLAGFVEQLRKKCKA